jgi:hypothetical protein
MTNVACAACRTQRKFNISKKLFAMQVSMNSNYAATSRIYFHLPGVFGFPAAAVPAMAGLLPNECGCGS